MKFNYIGSSSIANFKFLSTQTTNVGKNTSVNLKDESPKPIIIPPEPMPSIPFPTVPNPSQTPLIEIPGLLKKIIILIYYISIKLQIICKLKKACKLCCLILE